MKVILVTMDHTTTAREKTQRSAGRHWSLRHSFTSNRTWNALGLEERNCTSCPLLCLHAVDSENLTIYCRHINMTALRIVTVEARLGPFNVRFWNVSYCVLTEHFDPGGYILHLHSRIIRFESIEPSILNVFRCFPLFRRTNDGVAN
jgi:hypothetical protein